MSAHDSGLEGWVGLAWRLRLCCMVAVHVHEGMAGVWPHCFWVAVIWFVGINRMS